MTAWCSPRVARASVLVAAASLAVPPVARPNDGFYQGAGYHLVPVRSTALKVRRETLRITAIDPPRCHDVLHEGRRIEFPPAGEAIEFEKCPDVRAFAAGPPRPCGAEWLPWREFSARWRAEAVYWVEALDSVRDVTIAFPVPTWDFEYFCDGGLEGARLPAVVAFETFIDETRVPQTSIRELGLEGLPQGPEGSVSSRDKTLGYAWRASFSKGGRYTLRTAYDFGVDTVSGFYEGHEYPRGVRPWFLPDAAVKLGGAEHLLYYLTPIRSWAEPPPESISIRVDLPRDVPVTYFVPVALRPTCVDEHAYQFELAMQWPPMDIDIAYPMKRSVRPPIRTSRQWSAWIASLGEGVKLTCTLRDQLARDADKPVEDAIRALECVESCSSSGPRR